MENIPTPARWQDDKTIQTVGQLTVKVTQKSIGLYRKRTKGMKKRNPIFGQEKKKIFSFV